MPGTCAHIGIPFCPWEAGSGLVNGMALHGTRPTSAPARPRLCPTMIGQQSLSDKGTTHVVLDFRKSYTFRFLASWVQSACVCACVCVCVRVRCRQYVRVCVSMSVSM